MFLACSIIEFGLTIVEIWHQLSNVRKAKERWSEAGVEPEAVIGPIFSNLYPMSPQASGSPDSSPLHAATCWPSFAGRRYLRTNGLLPNVCGQILIYKVVFFVVTSSAKLRKLFGSRSRWSTRVWIGYIISYCIVETDWQKSCFWTIYSTPKSLYSLGLVLVSSY